MRLNKSKGNMYPWVTHTFNHLGGKCLHECTYCYVQALAKRYGWKRYEEETHILEGSLDVDFGEGKIIFMEHMNDLFAKGVKDEWVHLILAHCCKYPENEYVFQTKNPLRAETWSGWPPKFMMGTTIESNKFYPSITKAPISVDRFDGIKTFKQCEHKTFITIEPILDFDVWAMLRGITEANPDFVNIGADSKGAGLPEPSKEKVLALIKGLQEAGIEIRQKSNLERLLK